MGVFKIILVLTLVLVSNTIESQDAENKALYNTIMELDKTYFTAYNDCDMKTQSEFYDEDIEFYHDMGGLATDKAELLKSIEKNICGKVTRTLKVLVPYKLECTNFIII